MVVSTESMHVSRALQCFVHPSNQFHRSGERPDTCRAKKPPIIRRAGRHRSEKKVLLRFEWESVRTEHSEEGVYEGGDRYLECRSISCVLLELKKSTGVTVNKDLFDRLTSWFPMDSPIESSSFSRLGKCDGTNSLSSLSKMYHPPTRSRPESTIRTIASFILEVTGCFMMDVTSVQSVVYKCSSRVRSSVLRYRSK